MPPSDGGRGASEADRPSRRVSARGLLERVALRFRWPLERPTIFVLGLPGSGATLFARYLLQRLHVAYFTDGVGRHPQAPVVTTFLERRSEPPRATEETAPPATEVVWRRFFESERYTRFEHLGREDVDRMRNLVAATQCAFGGAPFVSETVLHLLRVDALAGAFPESLFVVVRRRLQDAALSILRARLATHDPTRSWFVRPPDWERLAALPLEEQVAGQVRSLRRRLDADLAALPRERVIALDYERFCREPDANLGPLRRMLGALGERSGTAGPFAVVHHVATNERERRLLALLAAGDARELRPDTGRPGGA